MPRRRFEDQPDRAPAREETAGDPRVRSQGAPAQVLAMQASVGNAAVARAIAAGQLGVAREDGDAYTVSSDGGASGYEMDEAFDERGEASEHEDPQARLVRAVSERIAEKGTVGERPPAPPDPYAVTGNGLRDAPEEAEHEGGGGASHYAAYDVSEDDVPEDVPASAGAAAPPVPYAVQGGEASHYAAYDVSEDEASEVSSDEESVADGVGGVHYTPEPESAPAAADHYTPQPEGEPAAAVPYTAPPAKQKMGKAKRALKALGRPLKAVGAAIKKAGATIKSAFKGRKGKKGKPTAAQLLADPSAVAAPASAASAAPVKDGGGAGYTPYVPPTPDVGPAAPHPLAEDFSISEDEPAKREYTNLAKMSMSPDERHTSEAFLNNTLLAGNFLAVDMVRFGLAPKSDQASVQKDPARVREGLKRVWGWSEEDVRKYYDASTGKAKNTKVEYITSEQDLRKFVVRAGATLQYGDPPQAFDTSSMVSKASGPGFAIFVMDGQGNIYAGQHRVGLFHHSSFLAGRAVAAAGEMKVSGGRLVEVTSKSGHYAPDPDQMHQVLVELSSAGVALAGVRIKLWITNPKGRGYVTNYYDAAEFLAKKLAATPTGSGNMFQ